MIDGNPTFDLQLFADDDEPDPTEDELLDDEEGVDPEDPAVLASKVAELEKSVANKEKRYRDVQSMSQKTKNQNDAMLAALDKKGLTLDKDGEIVNKRIDVSEPELDKDKFLKVAGDDPYGAIDKLTDIKVKKALARRDAEHASAELRAKQTEDMNKVKSLEGYTPEIGAKLLDIVKTKRLAGTVDPFSNAIFHLGDRELQEKMQDQMNIGAPDKSDLKSAAGVARGGKHTSASGDGTLEDSEAERQRLMSLPDSEVEKLVTADTIKKTGRAPSLKS